MIKAVENLQFGFETARSFERAVINYRISNLELSKMSTLETFHTGGVNVMDLDKVEERYLLSGAKDGGLCIHDLQNDRGKASYVAKLIAEVPRGSRHSHKFSIETVQWYPFDTGLFTSSGMDKQLKLWDANSLRPADKFNMSEKINNHHMSPVAAHHSLIAVAIEAPHVILLDPRSGSSTHFLRAHKVSVPCIQWSPSCEYLLATAGVDSKIYLWDIRSAQGALSSLDRYNGEHQGSRKDLITAHNGVVNGLRFTNDGLYLISCGTDSRVRLWDVALSSNTLVNFGKISINNKFRRWRMDICCDSSPPVLFIPSENYILAFNVFTGEKIETMVGHFSTVHCCVYRSSVHQLLSGGNDMNILLWTPDTQQELDEEADGLEESEKASVNSDEWSSDEG